MAFEQSCFSVYLTNQGFSSGSNYISGLRTIETLFSVDIDAEYERDACRTLLEKVATYSGSAQGNATNLISYLKKYLAYKSDAPMFSVAWFRAQAQDDAYVELCEKAQEQRAQFLAAFGADAIRTLQGADVLHTLFINEDEQDKSNMCSQLLCNTTDSYVSVNTGSMHTFGLFYDYGKNKTKKQNAGQKGWTIGSSSKEQKISEDEAIAEGSRIRDSLVAVADYIQQALDNDHPVDYTHLKTLFDQFALPANNRYLKYFAILFPQVIPCFYSEEWHSSLFLTLKLTYSDNLFVRLGIIADFIRQCGIDPIVFANIVFANLHPLKIWKISHGILDEDTQNRLLQRQVIAMSKNTASLGRSKVSQGTTFLKEVKKGDLFYLCHGNEIQIFGEITGDEAVSCEDMGEDWYEYPYTPLAVSVLHERYTGIQKRWTPNFNSTLCRIPHTDFHLFETHLLLPYFHLTLHDIMLGKYVAQTPCKNTVNTDLDLNTILCGPPGTGKTYETTYYAVAACDCLPLRDAFSMDYTAVRERFQSLLDQGRIAFTTFHQSYGYEEFIEGIKPVLISSGNASSDLLYEKVSGVFKSFCDNAKSHPDDKFIFIIDEINRGNISKIFGELITLIEEPKRLGNKEALAVTLPYSDKNDEPFGVPNNVYLLGTMNTADRSIALMDTALRRRFHFRERMPDPALLAQKGIVITVDEDHPPLDVSAMLQAINTRIEALYDRDHTIGHAFFMCLEGLDGNEALQKLGDIFKKSILPLLQEYFYEDYNKIRLVLGDNAEADPRYQFINLNHFEFSDIFKGSADDVFDSYAHYSIREDAFYSIESYLKII